MSTVNQRLKAAIDVNDGTGIRQVVEEMSAEDINKGRALHQACDGLWRPEDHGHLEALTALLRKPGIDVNIKDSNGKTPLEVSAKWCKFEAVTLLLSHPMIELSQGLEDIHYQTES